MKKIIYIIASAVLLFSLGGCEKEMMSYEGEVGVYFCIQRGQSWGGETTWPFYPTSNLEFVMYGYDEQHTIQLRVRITGNTSDQPRVFNYEIDPETTTAVEGVDYVKPSGEGVIPAGKRDGYVELTVNRTEIMKTGSLDIGLKLIANENFSLVFTRFEQPPGMTTTAEPIVTKFDATKHVVKANDILVQPPIWLGGIYQYGNFEEFNTFGVFGPKKFNLICELTGVTYSDFLTNPPMSNAYMSVLGRRVAEYLKEQYRNRTPVLEDDGRLMWVYGCGWTTYPPRDGIPGVVWDGEFHEEYFY